MNSHIRVSLKNMRVICGNCGCTDRILPGAVVALESMLSSFREAHSACPRPVFKIGDRVQFCGEQAVVVENFGSQGYVKTSDGQQVRWYWDFEGEPVIPVVEGE